MSRHMMVRPGYAEASDNRLVFGDDCTGLIPGRGLETLQAAAAARDARTLSLQIFTHFESLQDATRARV